VAVIIVSRDARQCEQIRDKVHQSVVNALRTPSVHGRKVVNRDIDTRLGFILATDCEGVLCKCSGRPSDHGPYFLIIDQENGLDLARRIYRELIHEHTIADVVIFNRFEGSPHVIRNTEGILSAFGDLSHPDVRSPIISSLARFVRGDVEEHHIRLDSPSRPPPAISSSIQV
jgi:hypothetical protein